MFFLLLFFSFQLPAAESCELLTELEDNYAQSTDKIGLFYKQVIPELRVLNDPANVLESLDELEDLINSPSIEAYHLFLLKGVFYNKIESWQKSIESYEQALSISSTQLPLDYLIHYELGALARAQKKYTEASRRFQLAEANIEETPCRSQLIKIYDGIAFSAMMTKNYELAESYYLLVEKLTGAELLKNAIAHNNLGNLYFEQYQDVRAKTEFSEALTLLQKKDSLNLRRIVLFNLYAVNEALGDSSSALQYLWNYTQLQDSIWNRDRVWELAEKDKELEVSKRESQIAIQEAEIKSQRWQINTYLSVAVLLVILAGVIGWGYNRVKVSNALISSQKVELEELNQTKNKLFSIVAHDLKSPVVSLQKSQEKLNDAIAKSNTNDLMKISATNSQLIDRTYNLLNNTLQWALTQTDQLLHIPEAIRLSRIADLILYDYREVAEAKGLKVDTDYRAQFMVKVDVNAMKTVFRNLIDNAIKFTNDGSISISTFDKDGYVMMEVADTGVGISKEKRAYLFETSQEKIMKDSYGNTGTGLGTVLIKSLVEKNGGGISIRNNQPKGTIWSLHLPAVIVS